MKRDLTGKEQVLMAMVIVALVFGLGTALAPPSLPNTSNLGIAIDTNGVVTAPTTIVFGTNASTGRSVIGPRGGIGVGTTTPPGAGNITATGTVTAAGFVSTGSTNAMKFADTNATPNVAGFVADNNMSDSVLQAIGLYYFASGGTNAADVARWGDFILTNNLGTNLTIWLTNGAVGKRFFVRILGPTNGNSYTLTLLSANSWLMNWDVNSITNGGTGSTITVSNNQSLEIDGVFTKTPTNPLIDLVYGRRRL